MSEHRELRATAPAKINLLLAITGVRADGFHNLVSLVAPIALADEVAVSWQDGAGQNPSAGGMHSAISNSSLVISNSRSCDTDTLFCSTPGVPIDNTNLVLRAAAAFRAALAQLSAPNSRPSLPSLHFTLTKNVPHGAGLGGGSSDGATALLLLNKLAGEPLDRAALHALAATLGSDCPLFLDGKPVIMRGRGERVEPLTDAEHAALRGRRLLLFKPDFGVSTADAYRQMKEMEMAANGERGAGSEAALPSRSPYISETAAEARLAAWRRDPDAAPLPLFNNMEIPVFAKHLALPALLENSRKKFALEPRMSGSGSACFAFLPDGFDAAPVIAEILDCWGTGTFVCETTLL
jgi:4-diphosphocytidyl-2-C-methyl-D-erythritol kinase